MQIQGFKLLRLTVDSIFKDFDCGDQDLNDFIHHEALNFQNELLAVTYLLEDDIGNTCAFFSLSNDLLKDQDYERWNNLSRKLPNRKRRNEYPAVKIGRFGVSVIFHGNRLGTQIIDLIKNRFTSETNTGCRFILVDAYNKPEVLNFYQKNDFTFLTEKDSAKKTRLMYFDLIRMIPNH